LCGKTIAAGTFQCEHCGSSLVGDDPHHGASTADHSLEAVTTPLLISGIGNVVVGLLWLVTCYGIIFTVPMVILCVFEFSLYWNAPRMRPVQLVSRAQTLAVFEILVGLMNGVSLVCGILVLVGCSNLQRTGET